LLSVASAANLELASIDVKTAFLYFRMKETFYPGLSSTIMPSIVKFKKFICGLKQAAHEWRQ